MSKVFVFCFYFISENNDEHNKKEKSLAIVTTIKKTESNLFLLVPVASSTNNDLSNRFIFRVTGNPHRPWLVSYKSTFLFLFHCFMSKLINSVLSRNFLKNHYHCQKKRKGRWYCSGIVSSMFGQFSTLKAKALLDFWVVGKLLLPLKTSKKVISAHWTWPVNSTLCLMLEFQECNMFKKTWHFKLPQNNANIIK